MTIPEIIQRQAEQAIAEFCERRVPQHIRHQVRLTFDFEKEYLTLYEERKRYHPPDRWSRTPISQFRYDQQTHYWTLYGADRNGGWHRYPGCGPSPDLADLLTEMDEDPTAIFWDRNF